MNMIDGVLAYVVGPSIVTIGTVLAARLASRGSERAARTTAKVTEKSSAVDGYHQLVTDLQADVLRLRSDHNALVVKHEELTRHVAVLETQRARDKSLIRWMIIYIRTLRDLIVSLGGRVPEAPGDMESRLIEQQSY